MGNFLTVLQRQSKKTRLNLKMLKDTGKPKTCTKIIHIASTYMLTPAWILWEIDGLMTIYFMPLLNVIQSHFLGSQE